MSGQPGPAGVPYHPPCALSSDVVLSEDHYLLRLHQIDPANDIVMAYSRADGEAEAMLPQPIAGRAGVPGPVRDGRRNSQAVQAPLR